MNNLFESVVEREKLRYSYLPRKVRLLFIAESPPSSGGFFYKHRTIGRDYLFAETMRALGLWPDSAPMSKDFDKRPLLKEFQSMGCFLIDSSLSPVDKLREGERNGKLLEETSRLLNESEKLNPDTIVLVKKNVFMIVKPELEKRHLAAKILNKKFLPFPSHGHQPEYRRRLRRLLDRPLC